MKKVDIISKVVGRAVDSTHVPSTSPGASVNLSEYLLKSVWESVWEVRKTDDGTEYLFGKLPVALQYGLTFFVDGGNLDLPGIYAGLPIDNQTIYWEEVENEDGTKTKRLRANGGGSGGGSIEYPLSWSGFSSGSWDGKESKNIYIPSKTSELTNDASFVKTSEMNTALAKYLPLTGGTLTGELVATTISGGGENLYLGNEDNSAYVYLNEDMRSVSNGWAISKAGDASFSSLSVNGNTAIHAGNYTSYFNPNNYITSISNVQATEGGATFNRYLGITKGGVSSNLTVGYATHARNLKAYGVSNLGDNSSWNTYGGLKCGSFSSSASGIPTTPGSNANSIITHMPTYNYGIQIAHICELSGGLYPSGVHLFARTLVNGSYKTWRRIITNGSTMTFDVYAAVPYINLISNSVTYKIQANNGLYLGISTDNGVRIDSSGNLLATGSMTFKSTSDRRLKRNIRSFKACEVLMSLGGVYQFEYTDNEVKRNGAYKGTHIGLIYQNVKGTELERMCLEREDGYGSLNYIDTSFISLLAGVGMEHETRIQKLERENRELKMEVERLKRL